MDYKIAFIAPYKKLGDLMEEAAKELGIEIDVYIGNLEDGAKIAQGLEDVDVVISRGGTAIAIKNVLNNTPLIEIQVTGYDLIKIIHQVRQETSKIAVVGFNPFTYGIEDLGDIMDVDLNILTMEKEWYNKTEYMKDKLKENS